MSCFVFEPVSVPVSRVRALPWEGRGNLVGAESDLR